MNMKFKSSLHNQLAGKQILVIENETLEKIKELTYLGKAVSANPTLEIEIRKQIGIGWSAFG